MPYPDLLYSEPLLLQQSTADPYLCRRHSDTVLAQSLWEFLGPGAHKVCLSPLECLWWVRGLILNMILCPLQSCCSFPFALGCGVSLFGVIQHSRVNGYSATSCNFGVLAGEDGHTSFYSAILDPFPKSKYKLFVVRIKCIYNLKLFFFCIVTFDLKKNNTEPLCLKYRTASQICCVYITNCLPDHE